MRNFFKIILVGLTLVFGTQALAEVYVKGYTRKDGTQVQGHYRSKPNSTVRDNYSYYGNTNPRTGETGTNKNRNDPSSEYYNGGGNSYYNNNKNNNSRSNSYQYGW